MAKSRKKPTVPTLDERVELRMSPREKEEFQAAAARQGITFSQWLRLAGWLVINEHEGKVKLVDLTG